MTEAVTGPRPGRAAAAGRRRRAAAASARRTCGVDGYAIEARLYAEDAGATASCPPRGPIVAYREPAGVRVDSGIEAGTVVGTDYDPMLAK